MGDLGQRVRSAVESAQYPCPATSEDIDRVLLVMLTAQDHLGIDWLTPHEISTALRTGFRLNVPRQRVQSLLDANRELALRRKISGKRRYQILDAGCRRMQSTASMDVVFIQPEHSLTGVRQVQDLMGTRAGLVHICDPYLAPRTLDYLAQLTSASEVRALTRNIDKENTLNAT